MALRFEAWTLPWVDPNNFVRKIAHLPVLPGTGTGDIRLFSMGGNGECEVSLAQFSRIEEVVSPVVASLIRVYDGAEIIHEWICSRAPKDLTSQSRTAPISGPTITNYFDQVLNYPREYPDILTEVQDTIWAGENALDNPSMEEAEVTNTKVEVWADATGGTFTFTILGDTTAPIDWDASVVQMEQRLQDLASIDDVLVSAGDDPGTEGDPWQIEFIVPAIITGGLNVDDALLTGLTSQVTVTVLQEGQDDIPLDWTMSQYADRRQDPRFHGTYASDGFRRDDTVAHSGTYSIRINPLTRYGGGQQVVRVEPGMTYQASIWVYTTDPTEVFKFIARSAYVDGEAPGLAQDGGSIPASTWTEFSFELVVPADVDTVIFRIAAVGNENPIPFWIDDGALLEGMAAATPGEIISTLLDVMSIDHVSTPRGAMLDWVDYSSFSDTLDSNGNAWSSAISFTAQYGETFGQILDKIVNKGFEWDLLPKATPAGGKTHDLHLYNKGGRDSAPSTAINTHQGITGGEIIHRHPTYDAVFVEGTTSFVEVEDAGAIASFGRMEKFIASRDTPDNDTLTLIGNEALDAESSNRTAVRMTVVETPYHSRPGRDYRPGDTLPMQAPPALPKETRRVVAYDYANTFPTQYSVTGSRVFGGEAAAFELVWRLWRRFLRPEIPHRRGAVTGTGANVGASTYTFSTSDSSPFGKSRSDTVLSGSADGPAVQAILDQLSGVGGKVRFTEGSFDMAGHNLMVPQNVYLEGAGQWATRLEWDFIVGGVKMEFAGNSGMRQIRIQTYNLPA